MSPAIRLSVFTALVLSACDPAPTATRVTAKPEMGVLAAQGGNKCAVVILYPSTDTIPVGGTVALVDTVANKKGFVLADAPVAWSSQNPTIATVSANGVVTGIAAGDATIAATCETGLTGTSIITVGP